MAWYNARKFDTGSFTSMNSIRGRHGSWLRGAVLGAAIIGLSLAPLPATANAPIAMIDKEIKAALKTASTARAAYSTYFMAATEGCLSHSDYSEICGISTLKRQVADTETGTVSTPHEVSRPPAKRLHRVLD